MPEPAVHHPQEWPVYPEPVLARAKGLLAAGRTFDYARGAEITELEQGFQALLGRSALALNSGTSALFVAYHTIGLEPGDEVVVPSYTFYATATPLLLLRAVPVLCDAGDRHGNVTAATIRALLTERTRAVVVTHLAGWPCDLDEIVALCRERNLVLIEDCSHAHGSWYRGARVGTFGDFAVFSIGGHKLVTGGLGGILAARDPVRHEIACLTANFRPRTRSDVHDPDLRPFVETGLGGNLRISPIAAVLATGHLADLDRLAAVKDRNARHLLDGLSTLPGLEIDPADTLPGMESGSLSVNGGWYEVNAGVAAEVDLDALVEALRTRGLRVRRPATVPLHRAGLFIGAAPPTWREPERAAWGARVAAQPDCVAAERHYARSLALPAGVLWEERSHVVEQYVHVIGAVMRGARVA